MRQTDEHTRETDTPNGTSTGACNSGEREVVRQAASTSPPPCAAAQMAVPQLQQRHSTEIIVARGRNLLEKEPDLQKHAKTSNEYVQFCRLMVLGNRNVAHNSLDDLAPLYEAWVDYVSLVPRGVGVDAMVEGFEMYVGDGVVCDWPLLESSTLFGQSFKGLATAMAQVMIDTSELQGMFHKQFCGDGNRTAVFEMFVQLAAPWHLPGPTIKALYAIWALKQPLHSSCPNLDGAATDIIRFLKKRLKKQKGPIKPVLGDDAVEEQLRAGLECPLRSEVFRDFHDLVVTRHGMTFSTEEKLCDLYRLWKGFERTAPRTESLDAIAEAFVARLDDWLLDPALPSSYVLDPPLYWPKYKPHHCGVVIGLHCKAASRSNKFHFHWFRDQFPSRCNRLLTPSTLEIIYVLWSQYWRLELAHVECIDELGEADFLELLDPFWATFDKWF